ncbi:hypothetical protein A5789_32210 [Nocardia sp. 852002-51101_SCH5132738]|uniref:hypothetical protein n=1 Tax=Nocardia sp. 852002-51101_SCH5132738 TaxID=1834095 RepID=UPI0007EB68E3|nr:hypothetical protein [Nocardia sp. 852002-51101_SCH5132738]OBA49284.1 hypothetical protein A5789_32210 [Nocardia sp. 852002-51101_SCH5132738]
MSILFGIGLVIWFVSIAAMFLARALDDHRQQVFRASLALCAVGSILLAIGTPFVSGNSINKNILVSGGFTVMASLCAYSVLITRHRRAGTPVTRLADRGLPPTRSESHVIITPLPGSAA